MLVRVYWNRNVRQYSVMDFSGGEKHRRVIGHAPVLFLRNITMVVSQPQRRRCLKTKHRNVHAFLQGERMPMDDLVIGPGWVQIDYSLDRGVFFNVETNEPVECGQMAVLRTVRGSHGRMRADIYLLVDDTPPIAYT